MDGRYKPLDPDGPFEHPATPRVIDFACAKGVRHWRDANGKMHEEVKDDRPRTSHVTSQKMAMGQKRVNALLTAKQLRARARRSLKQGTRLSNSHFEGIMKPLDDWDSEELARGRPRNAAGTFGGRPSQYITRELHERAMEKFKVLVRDEMNVHSITALKTIQMVLESEEVDFKGKPIVGAAQKLDAAKFLLEHIVGKPTQPTTTDISVKLQGILGTVMVNPAQGGFTPAHMGTRGEIENIIDVEVEDEDEFGD